MKTGYYSGAMYVKLDDEKIDTSPLELGDAVIYPGQYVNKLGEVKRTSFEMQEGWYLKYIGKVDNFILFDTNSVGENTDKCFYGFAYVDKNTLLIQGTHNGFRDIRINKLNIYDEVKIKQLDKQLSLF